MQKNGKRGLVLLLLFCAAATVAMAHGLGGLDPAQMQRWLAQAGFWAPLIYVVVYVVATLLIMPSTALNLTGGAIFGVWMGTVWTSVGAIAAAVVAFAFTRTIGRDWMAQRLEGRWQSLDTELHDGGLFYMFAIRLLPLIPYGLVNFAAGLTSIRFRDYLIGTALGTVPGILPFVLLGSSGLAALQTGNVLPLMFALGLIGLLVAGATWYRRHRASS